LQVDRFVPPCTPGPLICLFTPLLSRTHVVYTLAASSRPSLRCLALTALSTRCPAPGRSLHPSMHPMTSHLLISTVVRPHTCCSAPGWPLRPSMHPRPSNLLIHAVAQSHTRRLHSRGIVCPLVALPGTYCVIYALSSSRYVA